MLGRLLDGRYEVTSVLGSGGFSQTYIARDIRRPSFPQCVVKHLQPFSQEPNFLQELRTRFQIEAEALEKLGVHDQIPQLLACFETDEEFYLVQEFVEGHSLSDELLPGQRRPEAEVVALLGDILKVLEFIHHQRVVHRDIKPNNLLRRKRDRKIVLIDFGAVKAIQTQILNPDPTIRIGTPGYTPPEQEAGQPGYNSDLYALGMTAIQALTGVHPSQLIDPSTGKLTWRAQAQVSSSLAAVLDRMVCYRPSQRYQSARECLERLTAIAEPSRISTATLQIAEQITKIRSGKISPHLTAGISFGLGLTVIGLISIHNRDQAAQATLAKVKRLQSQGQYQACLEQAKTLTQNFGVSPSLHGQAETVLNQCQIELDGQKLRTAQQLATTGKLVNAITSASKIPEQSQLQPQAQRLIETWTQRLLELGWAEYHRGDLAQAIAYAESVPVATPDYQTAQTTITQWQKSWQVAETHFRKAQQAFEQSQWQVAIQLAQDTPTSENHFWQAQLAGLERRAQAAQQAEAATRSQRITRTLERLNQDLDLIGRNALEQAYPDKTYKRTEALSELQVRRNGDRVTFRFTVISQGWFWRESTAFDWEVLMLQQQHVQAAVANGKLDSYRAEELNNYFLSLAKQYL